MPLHNIHANHINCRFNAKDQNHVQYIKIKACESIIFKYQLLLTIIMFYHRCGMDRVYIHNYNCLTLYL